MITLVKWRCPVCCIKVYVPIGTPRIFCCCGYIQHGGIKPGLGDVVAAVLHVFGITPSRYRKIKSLLGLEPVCKCQERQSQLNMFGQKIKMLS